MSTRMQEQQKERIPERTIEVFARSFFKEASSYGFGKVDFLRFVNQLLDFSMDGSGLPGLLTNGSADGQTTQQVQNTISGIPSRQAARLPIEGKRVKIQAFESDGHRNLIKSWLSDQHGRHFMLSRATSRTGNFDELVDGQSSVFGMIALPDDTVIGSVAFLDYDPMQGKAEMRKLIGDPDMRGKGLAKEASELWIRYGTRSLGLKKIFLSTLEANIRNIKLNEELGFKFEGILRNEVFFDNAYHDVLRMAMWAE